MGHDKIMRLSVQLYFGSKLIMKLKVKLLRHNYRGKVKGVE